MSSYSRTAEREEERRLNMRTLVIASIASAAAALLVSQLSTAGTWIAAAMTPVIVSLVSEMLNRPTERIAKSFTSDRRSLAAAGGAGRPARPGADPLPDRAPIEPAAGAGQARPPVRDLGSEAPIRVYRAGEATSRSNRRLERGQAAGARGYGAGAGGREGRVGGEDASPRGYRAGAGGREGRVGGEDAGARGYGAGGRDAGAGGREARAGREGAGARSYGAGAGGQGAGASGIGAGAPDRGSDARSTVLGTPGMPPAGRGPATRRRKIAFGAVFATAAIAFVIAVAALTLPELVAGGSVGKNDGRTTLFGGKKSDDRTKEQAPQDTTEEEQAPPEEEQEPTTPEEETTPPAEEEPPPAEEEAAPQQAPAPGEPLPETTPVPPPAQP